MRIFLPVLIAALLAAGLPSTASPILPGSTISVRFDDGANAVTCAVPAAGITVAKQAFAACAASTGTDVRWDFGECFLGAVNGVEGEAIDPTGSFLLGSFWTFRHNVVAPSFTGPCDTPVAAGDVVSYDLELTIAFFVQIPTAGTAAWTAQSLVP